MVIMHQRKSSPFIARSCSRPRSHLMSLDDEDFFELCGVTLDAPGVPLNDSDSDEDVVAPTSEGPREYGNAGVRNSGGNDRASPENRSVQSTAPDMAASSAAASVVADPTTFSVPLAPAAR